MSTFLVDDKNDLILVGGTLNIENGLQGALLAAKHYAQTLRGEMMHDMQSGVRFFETAYNQPRLNLFANDMRRRIMQVDGVRSVTKFDARLSQDELIYSLHIETIWGSGEVSNISVNSSGSVGSGSKRCEDATLFGFYIENGDLIFYSDNDAGTSPRMYIDDDGYLIMEAQ